MTDFPEDYAETGCLGMFPARGISDLADRKLPPIVYTPIEHRVMPNPYAKKFKIDRPKHIYDEV